MDRLLVAHCYYCGGNSVTWRRLANENEKCSAIVNFSANCEETLVLGLNVKYLNLAWMNRLIGITSNTMLHVGYWYATTHYVKLV